MTKDNQDLAALERELAILTERVAEKRAAAREQAKRDIQELARHHGLTVTFGSGKDASAGGSRNRSEPKYKHPTDGRLTWTGKGRKPKWLEDALAGDRELAEFLVSPMSADNG